MDAGQRFLLLLGLVILLVIDVFVVAYRAALSNASLARLLSLREEMEEKVNRTVNLIHAPQLWQAGGNLAQLITHFLGASLLIAAFFPQEWTVASVALETGILLLAALLVFGLEWTVEVLVIRSPETYAMRLAPYVRTLTVVLSPVLALPLALTRRERTQDLAGAVTEEELKSMVDAGHEGGVLEQDERQMIYSIFELGDTLVREIMLPRIYITALDVNTSLPEAIKAVVQSGHSRMPVYIETVDNILGLLYAKDLLRVWHEGSQLESLRGLLRPAYFVPEAKKVDELLAEMQSGRVHMAIVVDEYGGIAGLVTLEDIVEEILGEIQDEYDLSEELPFTQVGEGEYLFQGRIGLDDFNEIMGSHLPVDEAETLGGFIYDEIGRAPTSGENLHLDEVHLTVEQVTGRRIRKVRARRLPSASEAREELDHVDE